MSYVWWILWEVSFEIIISDWSQPSSSPGSTDLNIFVKKCSANKYLNQLEEHKVSRKGCGGWWWWYAKNHLDCLDKETSFKSGLVRLGFVKISQNKMKTITILLFSRKSILEIVNIWSVLQRSYFQESQVEGY